MPNVHIGCKKMIIDSKNKNYYLVSSKETTYRSFDISIPEKGEINKKEELKNTCPHCGSNINIIFERGSIDDYQRKKVRLTFIGIFAFTIIFTALISGGNIGIFIFMSIFFSIIVGIALFITNIIVRPPKGRKFYFKRMYVDDNDHILRADGLFFIEKIGTMKIIRNLIG